MNILDELNERLIAIDHKLQQIALNNQANKAEPIQIITVDQLCEVLNLSEGTIIRMRKRGEIPFLELGGSIRYNLPAVIKSLESKTKKK